MLMRTAARCCARLLGIIALITCVGRPALGQDASGAVIVGMVLDSLRGDVLRAAVVQLLPGKREALTNDSGAFVFRNVATGRYTLRVLHSMLDTLGIVINTPEF